MAEPARDPALDAARGSHASEHWFDVTDLARHFEVSPPLLSRLVARRPQAIVRAVNGISFGLEKGETFALVGESGSGKSTVARLVVGLHAPTSGSIRLEGREIGVAASRRPRAIRRRFQMIFQDPYASLNPRWPAIDVVTEPVRGLSRPQRSELAASLLVRVGLAASDVQRFPHELSGGQRQRVSIARALASDADLIVCDEPTSALDASVQAQILNLMRDLQRERRLAYLFISHDLAVVRHLSSHVGVMYLGKLVESGPTGAVFDHPLHPYTRMLLDAVPDVRSIGRRRMPIAGDVPSPTSPPPGCSFHPRCPWANERCTREVPQPLERPGGVRVACHAVQEERLASG